ncbi:hypothetical protein Taro_011562 [Colocasia esculenta]|uniref:Uncharacterized protein n=1 Tax=Colocasia esculenta TaxID=4460 RepID=A0A843UB86_COLES|nr:hypothetical protein [Colocasia esculenta]
MMVTFPAHAPPDEENFGATSPLNASKPDSSETCVIFGGHSESTEPLSGETQQLSIAFEAACDVDEDWTDPHRLLGFWRLGWPLFVVRPWALLARFPWCETSIPLFSLHHGVLRLPPEAASYFT